MLFLSSQPPHTRTRRQVMETVTGGKKRHFPPNTPPSWLARHGPTWQWSLHRLREAGTRAPSLPPSLVSNLDVHVALAQPATARAREQCAHCVPDASAAPGITTPPHTHHCSWRFEHRSCAVTLSTPLPSTCIVTSSLGTPAAGTRAPRAPVSAPPLPSHAHWRPAAPLPPTHPLPRAPCPQT